MLYSHRSNILHAMGQCMADSLGMRSSDRVMPVVPMFHANAWGMPYASAMTGADLVMPGPDLSGPALAELIESERVTVSGAVPTIWMDLLRHADEHHPDLSSLRLVICGGSAVPLSLMQALRGAPRRADPAGLGDDRDQPARLGRAPSERRRGRRGVGVPRDGRAARGAGRGAPGARRRQRGARGTAKSTGELQVRGPWVAREYYRDESSEEKFDEGWLRTGDIAAIDDRGYILLSDRAKDVIKSGGEWISSVELENAIMAHPAVREAAVIARPDERWGERPLACVVTEEGEQLTLAELHEHLSRAWRSGGSPTRSRSSTRCRRRASASSTRRCCARPSRRAGSRCHPGLEPPGPRGTSASGLVDQCGAWIDIPLQLPVLPLEALICIASIG